jgi:hypothetical protein
MDGAAGVASGAGDRSVIGIDLTDLRFSHISKMHSCPGLQMMLATHFQSSMPVCTIWYRQANMNTLEIIDVYTHPYFRRQGVALASITRLPHYYAERMSLSTATVNDESRGLILKAGFQQERDGWFLRPHTQDPEYSI